MLKRVEGAGNIRAGDREGIARHLVEFIEAQAAAVDDGPLRKAARRCIYGSESVQLSS